MVRIARVSREMEEYNLASSAIEEMAKIVDECGGYIPNSLLVRFNEFVNSHTIAHVHILNIEEILYRALVLSMKEEKVMYLNPTTIQNLMYKLSHKNSL
jgi:hypothetical protein